MYTSTTTQGKVWTFRSVGWTFFELLQGNPGDKFEFRLKNK
jgi:hypothetical protein